jgi:hypothetical protein
MDTTFAFIGLLVVLFIGQVFMNENFYNFSPVVDTSGNVTLSLSDLMTLLGSTSTATPKAPMVPMATMGPSSVEQANTYGGMRNDIIKDVKEAVKNEMLQKQFSEGSNGSEVMDDSCIDSLSAQQGADFMRYIPGKNPDDYIRKDSVPCYGCSIPT